MSSTTKNKPKYIPLDEAARILKVHRETLRRWDNAGKLKAVRVGTRKDRKYMAEDVIKMLQERA